jgi:oligopeptidase B
MNQVFETHEAFLAYSSLNCPRTVYAYDMRDDSKTVVKRTPVLGFDGAKYAAARMEIEVRDGVKVPVSLAWKRRSGTDETIAPPRDAPVLLTGYGSYGVSNDPSFARDFVPLMDRGVVVCVAHVRGGGEMGRAWYEAQGKYLRKKNTFRDFVDVASALVANGTTSPEKLAISGRSAGGLLVGASINLAPRLFKCAVAAVPFVDVMVSMCDASIPLTTGEWEEWGNPNEMKYFPYMLSYSPMENIAKRGGDDATSDAKTNTRPELLVTAGLHDPRVAYWEGAKYAARMREATTNGARVLLKTDLDAGHFSASDRYKYFKEKAVEHAFVLDSLGVSSAKPKWVEQ